MCARSARRVVTMKCDKPCHKVLEEGLHGVVFRLASPSKVMAHCTFCDKRCRWFEEGIGYGIKCKSRRK